MTHETSASFLEAKLEEVRRRGLLSYPPIAEDESEGIRVLSRLLPLLRAPIRIRHPHHDLELALPALLGARMIYLIAAGDYEQTDLELILRWVRAGDTVLELGGGAGLTTALLAKTTQRPVTLVEPDVRLFPSIAEQVRLNGGQVEFVEGCVGADCREGTVPFLLADAPWFSTLFSSSQPDTPKHEIRVNALDFRALLEQHRPSVLFVDVEGAEQNLFAAPLAWLPRLILIEVHYPLLGSLGGARVVQHIVSLGYRLLELDGWTHVFERDPMLSSIPEATCTS